MSPQGAPGYSCVSCCWWLVTLAVSRIQQKLVIIAFSHRFSGYFLLGVFSPKDSSRTLAPWSKLECATAPASPFWSATCQLLFSFKQPVNYSSVLSASILPLPPGDHMLLMPPDEAFHHLFWDSAKWRWVSKNLSILEADSRYNFTESIQSWYRKHKRESKTHIKLLPIAATTLSDMIFLISHSHNHFYL
jgi:hypothetical protein